MVEECNADLLLHIVQFLNIRDSGCLALMSKRFYYLVHQFRKLKGPDVVTVASWNQKEEENIPANEMVKQAIGQIQVPPNFVLAFQNSRSDLHDYLTNKNLPKSTIVLGVSSHSIQVNLPDNNIEHSSNASAMYSSFPNSVVEPFMVRSKNEIDELKGRFLEKSNAKQTEWKAMIIYACGNGHSYAEFFLSEMQSALPNVTLVGGICSSGYISRPKVTKEQLKKMTVRQLKRLNASLGGGSTLINFVEKSEIVDHILGVCEGATELIQVEDAVFGVALGGDIPIRSMVSRGVKSITHGGTPQPSSPFVVHESSLTRPGDDDFLIHEIRLIRNVDESKIYKATEMMGSKYNAADFIGIKKPGHDGFELNVLHPFCYRAEAYIIMTNGKIVQEEESLEGAEIDFFELNGDYCLHDMKATVTKLKEQTTGEEILGAVMFSCNGRGPGRGHVIREEMADASIFASSFPNVPCLGFYAGGEIGPLALAGKQNVFQTGRASLQGFTAVFALFVVPVAGPRRYYLDDCEDNVNTFFSERSC